MDLVNVKKMVSSNETEITTYGDCVASIKGNEVIGFVTIGTGKVSFDTLNIANVIFDETAKYGTDNVVVKLTPINNQAKQSDIIAEAFDGSGFQINGTTTPDNDYQFMYEVFEISEQ